MNYPYNKSLTPIAKELRKKMTPEERKLWYEYLSKLSIRFTKQKIIDNYLLDFYCSKCKLCIEIDGEYHEMNDVQRQDEARTKHLALYNITVVRFTNDQIRYEFEAVCKRIGQYIVELYGAKFSAT